MWEMGLVEGESGNWAHQELCNMRFCVGVLQTRVASGGFEAENWAILVCILESVNVGAVLPPGEDLAAGFSNEDGVFELSGVGAIGGGGGPIVGPNHVLPVSVVNHGFDGEDVSNLHDTGSLVLGVVRHVGCAVEELADAVAAEGFDDAKALFLGVLCNDISELSVHLTRSAHGDGLFEALVGGLDELLMDLLGRTDEPGLV